MAERDIHRSEFCNFSISVPRRGRLADGLRSRSSDELRHGRRASPRREDRRRTRRGSAARRGRSTGCRRSPGGAGSRGAIDVAVTGRPDRMREEGDEEEVERRHALAPRVGRSRDHGVCGGPSPTWPADDPAAPVIGARGEYDPKRDRPRRWGRLRHDVPTPRLRSTRSRRNVAWSLRSRRGRQRAPVETAGIRRPERRASPGGERSPPDRRTTG